MPTQTEVDPLALVRLISVALAWVALALMASSMFKEMEGGEGGSKGRQRGGKEMNQQLVESARELEIY